VAVDLNAWRSVVRQVVMAISDEKFQRRAWFGVGPEVSSPDEEFCKFFGDAAIEDFLKRSDNGLNKQQLDAGKHLLTLMRKLSDETPNHIQPSSLIDDPRWQEVREAAAQFSTLLADGNSR